MEEQDQKEERIQERAEERPIKPRKEFVQKTKISPKRKFPKKVIIIVVILALFGAGGWFLFGGDQGESESELEITDTQIEEFEDTTTPTPKKVQIDRSEVEIEVLNGTGIAKEASYLQGKLRDLGYTEIETGNASDQDYEEAIVTFSSSLAEEAVDEITEELEDIYPELETKTSKSLDVDVQVITGLRKGQSLPTPEPTATPTPEVTATTTPTPTTTPSPTPTP
jgi:hypothetical protein